MLVLLELIDLRENKINIIKSSYFTYGIII